MQEGLRSQTGLKAESGHCHKGRICSEMQAMPKAGSGRRHVRLFPNITIKLMGEHLFDVAENGN